MNQHYFMIVNARTGAWLPSAKQKNKTSAELTKSEPPRLFATTYAAKNALRWWLKGIYATDRDGELKFISKSYMRVLEDMNIMEVRLSPVKLIGDK